MIIEEPSCRAAHHAELSDIWERSVRATHHWFDETDIRLLKATLPAHIDAFAHLLVAREKEKILGFIGIHDHFMDMLFVDADMQRRGIGTALLRELIGEAERRGVRQTELDVVAENRRARGLYEKMGFRAVATLPAAIRFTDGSLHDEIHMMRINMIERR